MTLSGVDDELYKLVKHRPTHFSDELLRRRDVAICYITFK